MRFLVKGKYRKDSEFKLAFKAVRAAQKLQTQTRRGDFPGLFVGLTGCKLFPDAQKIILMSTVRKYPQVSSSDGKDSGDYRSVILLFLLSTIIL